MRTLSEICRTIRSNQSLAKILPERLFRSIPIPAMTPGRIGIGFYYYLAGGKPGEPKTLFPPIFRIILNRETEELLVLEKAPDIWISGHQATTPLGTYPSQAMKGLSLAEMDVLYEEYYASTDRLMQSATSEVDLTASPEFPQWKSLYEKVREEGFDPYFATFFPALDEKTSGQKENPVGMMQETTDEAPASPRSVEQLKQVAERLMDTMDQTRKHIQQLGEHDLMKEWSRIRLFVESPSFSVAVAGEFNRGKTTLINKLLGTRLPEGDLPTTALLTQIVYGKKDRLTFIKRSGEKEVMAPTEENFNTLQAENDGNDPQGVLVLEIPNSWLGDHRLAVIDTPGAGDLTEHRAEIAAEAVMGADAALITVSATMPLSLSERVYVEEHVFAKQVPKVAVVITKLDLVPEDERCAVVENLTQRVKRWQPLAEVWLANEEPKVIDGIPVMVQGVVEIKKGIQRWRLDPEHLLLRQSQFQTQLSQLLGLLADSLTTRLELARANKDELNAEYNRLRRAVDANALGWGDLEIEMERRALLAGDVLKNQMSEFENVLCEKLLYQLSRTPNPREWWEKDLPFHLSAELKVIHRQLSGMLREHLLADIKWLDNQTEKRYTTEWKTLETVGTIISKPSEADNIYPEVKQLRDLNQIRMYIRAGMGIATVGGYMLFGPLGALVPAFGTLVTEKEHRDIQANQTEMLSKRIPDLIRGMLDRAIEEGGENIKRFYGRAVTEIRTQKTRWVNTQLEAIRVSLQTKFDESTITAWNRQLAEVIALLSGLPK